MDLVGLDMALARNWMIDLDLMIDDKNEFELECKFKTNSLIHLLHDVKMLKSCLCF